MTRGHDTKRKSDRNAIGKRSQKRSQIYARTLKNNFEISSQKPSKIALRASWAALAKTNGLQVRLGSSPGAFLNIFGAPGSVSQALLAGPGRPKSALGAPWARFWLALGRSWLARDAPRSFQDPPRLPKTPFWTAFFDHSGPFRGSFWTLLAAQIDPSSLQVAS